MKNFGFLFWNINNKDLTPHLMTIIEDENVNIIGLAEVEDIHPIEKDLGKLGFQLYKNIGCKRISILINFNNTKIAPRFDSDYYTINELLVDDNFSIIFAIVHFPSKLYKTEDDLHELSRMLKFDIERVEKKRNHERTIIFGDLNMNPFEKGVVSANSLHAISCALTAIKRNRVVSGQSYSMFYNPMWNQFGDNTGTPGSYFYSSSNQISYFWHLFDQVIIRPDLLPYFKNEDLKIINKTSQISFTDKRNRPNISDHLPLYFNISRSKI